MESILDPILIVDDEKDNLQALQRLLRGLYEVTTATSPFEALRMIQAKTYHVIISDQRMPEMTGVELLEKAQRLCPNSTRILLTGYTDIESVIDAINRGHIYRYVAKPWDPEDLRLTLKQANEAFRLRKEVEDKNVELEKALAELTVLDKAKARFLALVSHELNTPLTVIRSFVSLLDAQKESLAGEVKKSVSNISLASDRLAGIVGEVLAYVRLEGQTKTNLTKVSLKSCLEKAAQSQASALKEKKIKFEQSGDGSIQGDSTQLQQAAEKILSDLILRAPASSTISCTISDSKMQWSWQGPAIPEEAFAPFETGSSEMHHHKNLGLALAIAKQIFDRHHATVHSFAEKAKAVLSISFPQPK